MSKFIFGALGIICAARGATAEPTPVMPRSLTPELIKTLRETTAKVTALGAKAQTCYVRLASDQAQLRDIASRQAEVDHKLEMIKAAIADAKADPGSPKSIEFQKRFELTKKEASELYARSQKLQADAAQIKKLPQSREDCAKIERELDGWAVTGNP